MATELAYQLLILQLSVDNNESKKRIAVTWVDKKDVATILEAKL